MGEFEKILVLSTSTVTSKAAIHHSVTLAKMLNAKLFVYHSDYDPFNIEFWNLPIPSLETMRESYRQSHREERQVLDDIIEKERTPGMQIQTIVNDEPIVSEIPRIVATEKIDLLLMTAFQETRLEHYIFSRAIHEIVRTMPCSILLVKESHPWEKKDSRNTVPV